MSNVSTRTGGDRRPLIWAGRYVDRVTGADLPDDCIVLGEQDVPPYELAEVLSRADILFFLDLLSFPLEVMTDDHWDVPIGVVLPSGFDTESLTTTFGSVLFERLGFFDRIISPDSAVWEELRRKYSWAQSQRVSMVSDHPDEVARAVCALLGAESAPPTAPGHDQHGGAVQHWYEGNRTIPTSAPHQAVHSTNSNARVDKALHRLQAAALKPRFTAPLGKRGSKVLPADVLEVGAGSGRWASSFDLTKVRFAGVDAREDLVRAARANFPDQRFDHLGPDLLFPYDDESFDLVFCVTFMQQHSAPAKRNLLSEMWRVARPGGRLLFLENFVFTPQSEELATYPISVTEFVDLILDARAGQVVLDYAESLRYPDEDLYKGGLISLVKLGVPTPGSVG